MWQSLIGLGSGHIFGLGLGGGREKYGTLPNAHTDFIFSVVGEELGLVGAVVLLGLFFALAWFGLRAAIRAPDRFGSLLAVGITTWITSQAVINIGAVIGVLPVTGIPAALHLLRRIVPHRHHGRLRDPAQHRGPGALGAGPGPSAAPTIAAVSTERGRYALVAGGGTAGHLQPALAIAEALVLAPDTNAGPSSSWDRPGVRTGPPWKAAASRSPSCPDGASSAVSDPSDLVRNVGSVARPGRGRRAGPRPGGPDPSAGGGLGRGLRQPAGLIGRGGDRGAAGAGQCGCRARGGQPAVRAVRPGQRGGLAGAPHCPGRW